MRQAIRGLVVLGLLTAVVDSTVRAQNTPDKVTVRDRKDGSSKTYDGQLRVSPAGFQVFGGDKFDKAVVTVAPDDILKVVIGDLPGVAPPALQEVQAKENKKDRNRKDLEEARTGYQALSKAAVGQARSKRYLDFKVAILTSKIVDDLDATEGWKEKADDAIKDWGVFFTDYNTGWEMWPAVRASTRLQIERGKYNDAARAWGKLAKSIEPPDAKVEATMQEIDLQIRAKQYPNAGGAATELLKTAVGARKDRLVIYEIAAKAGGDSKTQEGIDKIKEEMGKTKDVSVHATGYSMMAELYLAADKKRDAMWAFLWVETVLNQDKDEVFKAISRLADLFEGQMDEDQTRKYRDNLKRFRATF